MTTTKAPPPIPRPWATVWEGDSSHSRYRNCDGWCDFCGRPIVLARSYAIHIVGAGSTLAAMADTTDHGEEDLAWFSVGSGCARKIPAAYRERQS